MNDDTTPSHDSLGQDQPLTGDGQPAYPSQPAYPGPAAYPGPSSYPSQPTYYPDQPAGGATGGWHRKPKHPQATTVLVLGITSLATTFLCFFLWPAPLIVSVVAWVVGSKTLGNFDAAPHAWDGRNEINTGRVLGIAGTILNIMMLLAFIGIIALAIATESATDDYYYSLFGIG